MLKKQADIFKSLSDPNRIRILKMLQMKSMCVCEITEILGLAASTVSQHLTVLKNAGFIVDSKNGKWIDENLNNFGISCLFLSLFLSKTNYNVTKLKILKVLLV